MTLIEACSGPLMMYDAMVGLLHAYYFMMLCQGDEQTTRAHIIQFAYGPHCNQLKRI